MKSGNPRADHYTRRAKREGYPARSVYKLEEIQQKFRILHRGMKVLDIGASPGSWSMYTLEIVGESGRIIGVDLKDLPEIADKRFLFLKGDAFGFELADRIRAEAPFDAVLSDAAPSTTGNRGVDSARSLGLAEGAAELSIRHLRQGGNLVLKLFQGGNEKDLFQLLRNHFKDVKRIKPKATRSESFEIYLVAQKKIAAL